jgi:dihydrofolate reductase
MTIAIIAAVARNRVIGVDGDLPWRLPGDLPRVKAMTMGHVLIMGRKTYESIGRPLPGRTTIVVTRQPNWNADGVLTTSSIDHAIDLGATIDDELFIFGGAEIYGQTLDRADRLEFTEVHDEPDGDTYFPEVDWSQWRELTRDHQDGFDWVTYVRHRPD